MDGILIMWTWKAHISATEQGVCTADMVVFHPDCRFCWGSIVYTIPHSTRLLMYHHTFPTESGDGLIIPPKIITLAPLPEVDTSPWSVTFFFHFESVRIKKLLWKRGNEVCTEYWGELAKDLGLLGKPCTYRLSKGRGGSVDDEITKANSLRSIGRQE